MIIYLSLGSNLGETSRHLEKAISLIGQKCGEVLQRSAVYRTKAWGKTDQPDFLNQVLKLSCRKTAPALMKDILAIETEMGRTRGEKWGPRIIDIDLLFYGNEIIEEPGLTVPHPGIAERKFVLVPLNDLAPDLIHPSLWKSVGEMLRACPDESVLPEKLAGN
jgi:2-amino-4-hydroxy-6-hydroxymethyldihydropteridine diphosphokinase